MFINYKDRLVIYHPDGKFDQKEIEKLLDAAYKAGYDKGYDSGYAAGKTYYPYPYWDYRPYYVTTTDKTINVTPSITCTGTGDDVLLKKDYLNSASVPFVQTTISSNSPSSTTTTTCSCKEQKNGRN